MLVAEGQSDTSYTLESLTLSTKYYWKIVARDSNGSTTSGSTWFFVTGENQNPNKPSNPSPANKQTNVDVDHSLSWNCEDPDEDELTYDVYFGGTNPPTKVVSNQSVNLYEPGSLTVKKTYYWKVVAWDQSGNSNSSMIWSFTTRGALLKAEAGGPYRGEINEPIIFDASRSSHSDENRKIVSYEWQFGDGATGTGVTVSHGYNNSGTYTVRLIIEDDQGLKEEDKATSYIKSSTKNQPSVPVLSGGPTLGIGNTNTTYKWNVKSLHPGNQKIRFRIEWGDESENTITDYVDSGMKKSITHKWNTSGTYEVKIYAQDANGVESQPREFSIEITFPFHWETYILVIIGILITIIEVLLIVTLRRKSALKGL